MITAIIQRNENFYHPSINKCWSHSTISISAATAPTNLTVTSSLKPDHDGEFISAGTLKSLVLWKMASGQPKSEI